MKKKKGFKGLISTGLVLAMTMGLTACGKTEQTTSADASLAKQYVYSYEEIALPDLGQDVSISSVTRQNGKIYMVADIFHWDEETATSSREIKLLSMLEDGTDMQTIDLEMPKTGVSEGTDSAEDAGAEVPVTEEEMSQDDTAEEAIPWDLESTEDVVDVPVGDMALDEEYYSQTYEYTGYSNYVIGKSGNLYAVKDYYFEDYSDPENYISKQEYYICAWDLEGKFLWEKQMENLQTEESYHYIRAMIPSEDGSVTMLIGGDSTYKVDVDAEGNLSDKKDLPNGNEILQLGGDLIVNEDGTIFMTHYNEDWTAMYLTSYDVKTDTTGEKTQLPDSFMWSGFSSMSAGVTTDIVYSNSTGIFGYNVGEENPVQLMSYINSDLATTSMNKIVMLDENRFIGFYNDSVDYSNRAALFTKVNPEDIPDKEVIVLAGLYVGYDLKGRIVDFNRSNQQYRIVVKEYDSYNTMDDYNAGVTQLNNDIITGNMPDILISNTTLPIENYISKGLIADIGALLEQDEELAGVEYLENIFKAFSVDGKLYYVVPSFYVRTMVGKTSLVGDRESWTMQEFQEFVKTLPEGTQAIGELTREQFMYMMMQYCGNDFIDVTTGKCNFNTPEFISMLEFANTLPEELSEDYFGEDYWMNYQSQYRDGRTVLMEAYISSLRDMSTTMNGYFGEDVNFVGFPTETGKGAVVMEDQAYVLSAKSKNLDGAWQFVRYYLTDEYQESLEWGLPVNKKIFMEKAQEGLGRPYYIDENGEKVEYDNYFTINGEDVILDPLTQEQVDQIVEAIMSAEKRYYFNEDIQNIISEEAAAFFEGQKSTSEVAQIIQSRAQIFVDENR